MRLVQTTANRLAKGPTLLLADEPGRDWLLDTVRLYDPAVRQWRDRLVFTNGVLLFGPIAVTQKLLRQARLPAGVSAAYHCGLAVQSHNKRLSPDLQRQSAGLLLRGLATRLGATLHPGLPEPDLALMASVYSPHAVNAEQVIRVLHPHAPGLAVYGEHPSGDGSFDLASDEAALFVGYLPAQQFLIDFEPPALGELGRQRLHHYDLKTGARASESPRDLCLTLGQAALALASHADGVAIDMYGFRFTRPEDLLPG